MSLHRCLVLASFVLAGFAVAEDDVEPPLEFELTIGDQTLTVTEGDEAKLSGSFDDATVRVGIRPYRQFKKGGIAFEYPREYVYEADVSDANFQSWTVEGSNVVVMFFVIDGEFPAASYIEGLLPQFGAGNARVSDDSARIEFGTEELNGVTVDIVVAEQKLIQSAYEVPLKNGKGGLLVLQDSLNEDGSHSDEWNSTMKLIKRSFRRQK